MNYFVLVDLFAFCEFFLPRFSVFGLASGSRLFAPVFALVYLFLSFGLTICRNGFICFVIHLSLNSLSGLIAVVRIRTCFRVAFLFLEFRSDDLLKWIYLFRNSSLP